MSPSRTTAGSQPRSAETGALPRHEACHWLGAAPTPRLSQIAHVEQRDHRRHARSSSKAVTPSGPGAAPGAGGIGQTRLRGTPSLWAAGIGPVPEAGPVARCARPAVCLGKVASAGPRPGHRNVAEALAGSGDAREAKAIASELRGLRARAAGCQAWPDARAGASAGLIGGGNSVPGVTLAHSR